MRYIVNLERTALQRTSVSIDTENEEEARKIAGEMVEAGEIDRYWSTTKAKFEVTGIRPQT